MVEIWKDCFGFEDYIMVSNLGRVYRKDRMISPSDSDKTYLRKGSLAKTSPNEIGYEIIGLHINGKKYNRRVHRLVLQTFEPIPNYESMTVNHKDGDKLNNGLDNLEWMTQKENINHAWETGLFDSIDLLEEVECEHCGAIFKKPKRDSKYCSNECNGLADRVVKERPSKDELYNLLCDNSFLQVGRKYGVSDNAIRKWCKTYGIPHKAKYYRGKKK